MLKQIGYVLALGFVLCGSLTARAGEPVPMFMHELKYRLNVEGTKHYNAMAREVFAGLEEAFDFEISPLSRSDSDWNRSRRACSFPSNTAAVQRFAPEFPLISSMPLDVVSVRVYLPPEAPDIQSLSELKGKNTAFVRGSFASELLAPYELEPVTVRSDEQLIAMLRRKRLDAFFGYHPDTAIAMEEQGGYDLFKVSSLIIEGMRLPVGVVCYQFDGAEALIGKINRNIIMLHREGRVGQILGKHAELPTEIELEEWIARAEQGLAAIY